jgi:uncharacterized protein YjiK
MTSARGTLTLAVCLFAAVACQSKGDNLATVAGSPTAVARATRLVQTLAKRDAATSDEEPLARWVLPRELREISGLTLTPDQRLLAESDEVGKVWEVDYRRGILVKRFALGNGGVTGDFEGITVANNKLFLLTSKGHLYEFREGANHDDVGYEIHDLGTRTACELEGIAFDPAINSLVLACKHVLDQGIHDAVVIYRWRLAGDTAGRLSRMVVPVEGIVGTNPWKTLHPTDITIDPFNGNYVLLTSKEQALIEITPTGAPVFARPLPPGHPQPEGIAITKDSILMISDEGGSDLGTITLYKWP